MWEEMEVASFEESLIGTGFAVEFAAAFLLDSKMSKKGFSHKPKVFDGWEICCVLKAGEWRGKLM